MLLETKKQNNETKQRKGTNVCVIKIKTTIRIICVFEHGQIKDTNTNQARIMFLVWACSYGKILVCNKNLPPCLPTCLQMMPLWATGSTNASTLSSAFAGSQAKQTHECWTNYFVASTSKAWTRISRIWWKYLLIWTPSIKQTCFCSEYVHIQK